MTASSSLALRTSQASKLSNMEIKLIQRRLSLESSNCVKIRSTNTKTAERRSRASSLSARSYHHTLMPCARRLGSQFGMRSPTATTSSMGSVTTSVSVPTTGKISLTVSRRSMSSARNCRLKKGVNSSTSRKFRLPPNSSIPRSTIKQWPQAMKFLWEL